MIKLWNFKEEEFTKAMGVIRAGKAADEYLGSLYLGDLSIDFKLLGEPAELVFDVYVGGVDSGYGYTQKANIPYDYADGGSICNGGNSSMLFSFDAFKIIAEYKIIDFIRDNHLLMEKANANRITMDWAPETIMEANPELFADTVYSRQPDAEFSKLSDIFDKSFAFDDFAIAFGEVISEATMEEDNDNREIGRHVYLLLEEHKNKPELLKAVKNTVLAITGWSIDTLTERLKANLGIQEKNGIDDLIEEGKHLAESKTNVLQQPPYNKMVSKQAKIIDQEKLKAYLAADMIMEFHSDKECMQYFNTYDSQKFETVEEMKEYQGEYGFGLDGKWYHISFDEALDVWKEEQELDATASKNSKKYSEIQNIDKER